MNEKLNVLIVGGNGAREFALTQIANNSPLVASVHTQCNNAGTQTMGGVIIAPTMQIGELVGYCRDHEINFVIIGPEAPLAQGWVDTLRAHDLLVFGPRHDAAFLESSKAVGRKFCERHDVPHPNFVACGTLEEATTALTNFETPYVIKLNGLCGGKGVTIHQQHAEATQRLKEIYAENRHAQLVLEDFLPDNSAMPRSEISIHVVISRDGSYRILPVTQDYKQRFDGDKGPMTGGMGCFGPVPNVDLAVIEEKLVKPTVAGIVADKLDYGGVLYIGAKMCPTGPFVVEYNVRFGDPEMVTLSELITSDLMELVVAAARGEDVSQVPVDVFDGAAVGVVVVNNKYPEKGPACIFPSHLNTPNTYPAAMFCRGEGDEVCGEGTLIEADGGRIAVVTRRRSTISAAREATYGQITRGGVGGLNGLHVRKDIAEGY